MSENYLGATLQDLFDHVLAEGQKNLGEGDEPMTEVEAQSIAAELIKGRCFQSAYEKEADVIASLLYTLRYEGQEKPDTQDGEKTIPLWARASGDFQAVIFDGRLREYRAKLFDGIFTSGKFSSNLLCCQPIEYRWVTEARWKGIIQPYLDFAFVDEFGVASFISLTRDSATNLAEGLRNLQAKVTGLETVKITLGFAAEADRNHKRLHFVEIKDHNYCSEQDYQKVSRFITTRWWDADCRWAGVWS